MDQQTIALFDQFTNTKKCLSLRPDELEMKILGCMKMAADLSQKTLTEGVIKTYIIEMIRDLKRNWEWLTIGELEYLMKQGAKGIYEKDGIIYSLSYRVIYNWMVEYRNSDERKEYIEHRQRETELRQKSLPPPPVDRAEHLRQMAITGWNIFIKLTNDDGFLMLPVEVYDYLVESGKVKMTNDEKKIIQDNVRRFLMQNSEQTGFFKKDKFPFVLETESDKENLRLCCKKWVVGSYFRKLINQNKGFEL